jgi:phosphopantetheine adenylyltransferase
LKRYRGTARFIRKEKRWLLKVTDTETNKVVEEVKTTVAKRGLSELDVAVVKAKELAKEWEKKECP